MSNRRDPLDTALTRRPQRAGAAAVLCALAAATVLSAAGLGAVRPGVSGPATSAADAAPGPPPGVQPEPARAAAEMAADDGSRNAGGFDHAVHDAIACTECHGSGSRHRTILPLTRGACASCHHAADRARECAACHAPAALPEPGVVTRDVSLGVWPAARVRQLPFGHALHAAVPCSDCHAAPVTLAMERTCGSCHASHHGAQSDCRSCHAPAQQPVHGAGVHLSCAGAACHAPDVSPAPTLSRPACVLCHPAQQDHEPGAACAACHLLHEGGTP